MQKIFIIRQKLPKTNENYGNGDKYTKHNQPDKDLVFDDEIT